MGYSTYDMDGFLFDDIGELSCWFDGEEGEREEAG